MIVLETMSPLELFQEEVSQDLGRSTTSCPLRTGTAIHTVLQCDCPKTHTLLQESNVSLKQCSMDLCPVRDYLFSR